MTAFQFVKEKTYRSFVDKHTSNPVKVAIAFKFNCKGKKMAALVVYPCTITNLIINVFKKKIFTLHEIIIFISWNNLNGISSALKGTCNTFFYNMY